MKKQFLLYILLFIFIILMLGCQKSKEKSKNDSSKENSPPPALEEIQNISEGIITSISKKDWNGSVEQIKSLHSQWNNFFSDAHKKGMTTEKTEEFNKDLNELTNLVISKAMEDSKSQAELNFKKDSLKSEQQLSSTDSQGQGGNSGNKEGSSEGEASSSGSKEGSSGGKSSGSGGENKEEFTLPEESLPDNFPLMTASPSELKITHAAVKLTKHIPYMTDLFETKIPSEILTLKYLIRDIKISSKQANWELVKEDLKEIEDIWPRLQPKIIEKKESLSIQFNQSLFELKDVVNQKDSTLTTIKSDITLENIKKMTELFE